jgi:hypothetical protein
MMLDAGARIKEPRLICADATEFNPSLKVATAPVLLAIACGLSHSRSRTMNIDRRKVNWAIRDCLSYSEEAPDRLAKIEGFLLLLRMSGEWTEFELHQVETRVRKMLSVILDDAEAPPEAI